MLSNSSYTQAYVDTCRARVESQLSAYDDLMSAASALAPQGDARLAAATQAFAPQFFTHMVMALDNTSATGAGPSRARTAIPSTRPGSCATR